jgi:hypothetical protein
MNPTWGWSQMVVAYSLLEASLWTEGHTQRIFALAAAVWIVVATLVNRRSLRQLGLGTRGFAHSLIAIPVALAAAAVIVLIGWEAGTLRGLFSARPPVWHSSGYAIWALVIGLDLGILYRFFSRRRRPPPMIEAPVPQVPITPIRTSARISADSDERAKAAKEQSPDA